MTAVNSVSYQTAITQVETLSSTPLDRKKFVKIKRVIDEFLQDVTPKLTHEFYKGISVTLVTQNTDLKFEITSTLRTKIDQTILNLLQGMRFLATTCTKQTQYLRLGNLYAQSKIKEAETFAAQESLNPTYAPTKILHQYANLAFWATAIGAASFLGNVEVVRALAPCVNIGFAIYGDPRNQFELPHILACNFFKTSNAAKIEILEILNKHGANPLKEAH